MGGALHFAIQEVGARVVAIFLGYDCVYRIRRDLAVDRDGVIAGGELVGLDVEHLAHLLAWAIQLKMKVNDILKLPFYHPTVEEGLRTALRDLNGKLN